MQLPQAAPLLPRLPQALRRLPQQAACARAVALERRRHHGQARRRWPLRRGGRRLERGGRPSAQAGSMGGGQAERGDAGVEVEGGRGGGLERGEQRVGDAHAQLQQRPSVYMYYRLDGVDAWRPPGVPARDGLVLLLMMYSSSRLV